MKNPKLYFLIVIMNSECSDHMKTNLDAFTSLDKSLITQVKKGDGAIQEAQGRSIVKVKSSEMSYITNFI